MCVNELEINVFVGVCLVLERDRECLSVRPSVCFIALLLFFHVPNRLSNRVVVT